MYEIDLPPVHGTWPWQQPSSSIAHSSIARRCASATPTSIVPRDMSQKPTSETGKDVVQTVRNTLSLRSLIEPLFSIFKLSTIGGQSGVVGCAGEAGEQKTGRRAALEATHTRGFWVHAVECLACWPPEPPLNRVERVCENGRPRRRSRWDVAGRRRGRSRASTRRAEAGSRDDRDRRV